MSNGKFYTNVSSRGNKIQVRYVEDGERKSDEVMFTPELFVPTNNRESYYTSLVDNIPLEKKSFETMGDARDFVKKYSGVSGLSIYGQTDYICQYIESEFSDSINHYNQDDLLIYIMDIETGKGITKSFPDPNLAEGEVWAITLLNPVKKRFYVFGAGWTNSGSWRKSESKLSFLTDDSYDCIYRQFDTEYELLSTFLSMWAINPPDIVTGWNVVGYDIKYLVNRMSKILGEKSYTRLSPWNSVYSKDTNNSYGNDDYEYKISGVAILDYMDLYKKFIFTPRESYSLDHIAYAELNDGKLDYSHIGDIFDLYKNNMQTAIDYNIKDVQIVQRLDNKLKLLDIVFAVAYYAKINYENIFSPVKTWDTIVYNTLLSEDRKIVKTSVKSKGGAYEGAFVRDPKPGFSEWIVSLDLNSLYPSIIRQYNMSIETLAPYEKINTSVDSILRQDTDLSVIGKKNNTSVCCNGVQFSNEKQGVFPRLMERLYKERKANKKTMLEWEKEYERVKHELSTRGLK